MRDSHRAGQRRASLVLVCAACALFPGAALAGTLDQQVPAASLSSAFSIGTNQTVAQTFTAGLSGKIDQVDVHVGKTSNPAASLDIQIQPVSGGIPTGTVLAGTSVPASGVLASSAFVPVTFVSPATVAAGTQYAIVASSGDPSGDYAWSEAATLNPYAGGIAIRKSPAATGSWVPATGGKDFAFKTYVVPAATGERAAALKKCKKKHSHKAKKKCKKKAKLLPV